MDFEQKRYVLLGEFTQKYIEYETLFGQYKTLLMRLSNTKPTSLHFYSEMESGKCVAKHGDNFIIIDGILSQLNNMLDELTVLDKRILKISKEYFELCGEIIPIQNMEIFRNQETFEYIKNKMEKINGR